MLDLGYVIQLCSQFIIHWNRIRPLLVLRTWSVEAESEPHLAKLYAERLWAYLDVLYGIAFPRCYILGRLYILCISIHIFDQFMGYLLCFSMIIKTTHLEINGWKWRKSMRTIWGLLLDSNYCLLLLLSQCLHLLDEICRRSLYFIKVCICNGSSLGRPVTINDIQ